jgi:GTP pyrophosphokinase
MGGACVYEQLIERFIQKAFKYPKADQEKFLAAATFAASKHENKKRASGEPYIIHPLAVGEILIQLKMDADTICAGLLHDTLEDTATTYEELKVLFGQAVADMVEGETKIANLKTMNKAWPRLRPSARFLRHEQGHPGHHHQTRRQAAQHAYAAAP